MKTDESDENNENIENTINPNPDSIKSHVPHVL